MSTIELARATRLHQEATTEHAEASAKAQQAADRLNDVQGRKDAITQRRLDGKSNDRDAAEFVALTADAELLQKMLGVARQAEALARDKLNQALQAQIDAQRAHDHGLAVAKFEALKAQCLEIEVVFCQALGELGRAGQAIGKQTFSSCFVKSDVLHRALDLNICPPKTS